MRFLFFALLFVVVAMSASGVAVAQESPPDTFFGGAIPTGITTGAGFLDVVENITDWIFVIVLVGSVIMIVLAGWQFISGGGEPQQVAQARNKLLYAAIGIAVAVLARGIPEAVRNIIGS